VIGKDKSTRCEAVPAGAHEIVFRIMRERSSGDGVLNNEIQNRPVRAPHLRDGSAQRNHKIVKFTPQS